MPEPVVIFRDILAKTPPTEEARINHAKKMDDAFTKSESDIQQALDAIDALEEINPGVVDYIQQRAEVLIALLVFETLHVIREKLGVHYHEYTITPNELLNSLVF